MAKRKKTETTPAPAAAQPIVAPGQPKLDAYTITFPIPHLNNVIAGLNELPGKFCNPTLAVINQAIVEQDRAHEKALADAAKKASEPKKDEASGAKDGAGAPVIPMSEAGGKKR